MSIVANLKGKTVNFDGTSYDIVEANNGDETCISLSHPITKLFLRHKNGRIKESGTDDNPKYFPMDSSFVPEEFQGGFVLHCSNPGLEHFYICWIDEGSFIVNPDLDKYIFNLEEPINKDDIPALPIIGKWIQLNDSRYDIVAANNGEPNCISLFNPKTNLYLRHKLGKIVETDAGDNPQYFPLDSSFIPEECGNGFILHCSNTGMKHFSLCQTEDATNIVNPGLLEHVFYIAQNSQDEDQLQQEYQFKNTTVSSDVVQTLFQAASAISISNVFPADTYLSDNPDVMKRRQDPIWHYVTQGFSKCFISNASIIDPLILLHILCPENPKYSFLDYLQGIAADYVSLGLGEKLKDLLMSARIDILPIGTKEQPATLIPEGIPDSFATFPNFLHKPEGNGCMIESSTLKTNCVFKCEHAEKVRFIVGGRDQWKRDDPKVHFPIWIRYEQLEITRNGEPIQTISEPFVASHNAVKNFTIDAVHTDIIGITARWTPCFHCKRLLYSLMCSLDENIESEQLARFVL